MPYILLAVTVIIMAGENVFTKQYGKKVEKQNMFFYSAISSVCALLFFALSSGMKLKFEWGLVPYSVGFALSYGASIACMSFAIKTGPLSISALILSYSLVIPTGYGILFLNEPIHKTAYIGMALLVISLFLINIKEEEMKFSPMWILYITLTFIGNGMCSTVMKMQQVAFEGAYKSEFMIIALFICAVILAVCGMFVKGDKKEMIKGCLKYAPFYGFANGAMNLAVIVMTGMIANAIMFPTISAGGIVLTFFISVFIYKEKLSMPQLTGYILGTASVVFLNI